MKYQLETWGEYSEQIQAAEQRIKDLHLVNQLVLADAINDLLQQDTVLRIGPYRD